MKTSDAVIAIAMLVLFFGSIVVAEIYGRKLNRQQVLHGVKVTLTVLAIMLAWLIIPRFLDKYTIRGVPLSIVASVLIYLLFFVVLVNYIRKRIATRKTNRNKSL